MDAEGHVPFPVTPIAAEAFNPTPGLALAIQITPDPLTVGESAMLSVQITNRAPYPAENMVVTAPTPEGALAESGPITINLVAGWRWAVGHLDGNASATELPRPETDCRKEPNTLEVFRLLGQVAAHN